MMTICLADLSSLTLSAAVTVTALMLIYSAQMGFYWYVGGMVYVGMHSFFPLLTAGWYGKAGIICIDETVE